MSRELNQSNPPSKVIHFRNVQTEISQQDLLGLCQKYGRISNIVMMKNKKQALVEFAETANAVTFISTFSSYHPTIRGVDIYPGFSQHQELHSSSTQVAQSTRQDNSPPSPVLLVTIYNPLYPITVDVLGQIFHQYNNNGKVEKIIIFTSARGSGNLQALIKFSSVDNATRAKEALQGKNIYSNCCTLQIQFSNNSDITVKENSERSFDFNNNSLPRSRQSSSSSSSLLGSRGDRNNYGDFDGYGGPGGQDDYGRNGGQFNGPNTAHSVLIVNGFPPEKIQCDQLFFLFSNFGQIIRIKILNQKPDTALIQFLDDQHASQALTHMKGVKLFGRVLDVNLSKHSFIRPPPPASQGGDGKTVDYEHSPLNRFRTPQGYSRNMSGPSATLHVSNLAEATTQEALSAHLNQAGEIVNSRLFHQDSAGGVGRVMYMALVEFTDVNVAVEAMCLYHNSKVDGQTIKLSFTRNKV